MAYLNVYQSGYYHRLGKPGQFNCHPGDLYPTYEGAVGDVDPEARHLYLGTFEVNIPAVLLGDCNPPDSVPVPLSQTRRELAKATMRKLYADPATDTPKDYRMPSHTEGMRPLVKAIEDWPTHGSLETSANEAVDIDPPNVVAFRNQRFGAGEEGR